MPQILQSLYKPILVMHAPFDKVVSIDSAAEIFKTAFHPKSFVSLNNADHLLSDAEDSLYASNTIAAWVSRYVNLKDIDKIRADIENVAAVIDDYYWLYC